MKQMIPVLFALLLISCKDLGEPGQEHAKILFENEYINYAWGFNYQGVAVDQEGRLYSYNPAKDSIPELYHADGYYSEQELTEKYQHFKTYLKQINDDTLTWSHGLASAVPANAYSDTTVVGADMGAFIYSVYIYRPQVGKYQKLVLKLEGDFTFYNKSESAKALAAWLKRL